jgi:ParB family chromosome partitioning protein
MPPRRGLGRGLDALIAPDKGADATTDTDATGHLDVDITRVVPNPRQPRAHFDEVALQELADSIRAHGVLQPIVVNVLHDDEGGPPRYQLIAGERRLQAARIAGLARVPVTVRDATPREQLELAIVENVQRTDLNALEAAFAYRQLATEFGMTQDDIGRRVGRNRHTVANTMRLLNLPPSVQQDVRDGDLSEGHARALLGLRDATRIRQVATRAIQEGLSVRQVEAIVRKEVAAREDLATEGRTETPAATNPLASGLRTALGNDASRVDLVRLRRGGRIVIHYSDDSQLGRIYARLATPILDGQGDDGSSA